MLSGRDKKPLFWIVAVVFLFLGIMSYGIVSLLDDVRTAQATQLANQVNGRKNIKIVIDNQIAIIGMLGSLMQAQGLEVQKQVQQDFIPFDPNLRDVTPDSSAEKTN